MNDQRIWKIVALAFVTFLYVQAGVSVSEEETLDTEWLQAVERLELRDDQVEPVRDALLKAKRDRREILRGHGVDPEGAKGDNARKLRRATPELRDVRAKLDERLQEILDVAQLESLRGLRQTLAASAKDTSRHAQAL